MIFLLVTFFVLFAFSALMVSYFIVFFPNIFFNAAFLDVRPKAFGEGSSSTDVVVIYWITRVLVASSVGILTIYLLKVLL